jgi:hypothetical protein
VGIDRKQSAVFVNNLDCLHLSISPCLSRQNLEYRCDLQSIMQEIEETSDHSSSYWADRSGLLDLCSVTTSSKRPCKNPPRQGQKKRQGSGEIGAREVKYSEQCARGADNLMSQNRVWADGSPEEAERLCVPFHVRRVISLISTHSRTRPVHTKSFIRYMERTDTVIAALIFLVLSLFSLSKQCDFIIGSHSQEGRTINSVL